MSAGSYGHQQPVPLADEIFRIGHDDTTGRPRLPPRALGLGLAGALLGELVLGGHITVHNGLVAVAHASPPRDALAHTVLDQLTGESNLRQVRTWLAFLAHDARDTVAGRLARAGHVRPVQSGWRRGRVVYEPSDMSTAAWPQARLRMCIERRKEWDYPDATLAGLVAATGLADQIMWGIHADLRRYFLDLTAWLPAPLRDLVAHTEAAVGNTALSHRT